ncbi:MAG: tRNA uracil 4-sulfurtransferase ThiI [Planctomycetota bacterium]
MERITAHYHELALKGGNRPRFERTLVRNLARTLSDLPGTKVRPLHGRVLIETEADLEVVLTRARAVCGVAYVLSVREVKPQLDAMAAAVLEEVRRVAPANFRVSARRVDKRFPMISPEINRAVGAVVHEATGIPVRLKGAEFDAQLTVMDDRAFVGFDKRNGVGGLPVGTGGRVAALFSGGFDSPVAAWRMMRRGCKVHFVHFHSHPLVDRTTQEKVQDLAEWLTRTQLDSGVSLVPLANIQTQVKLHAPEKLRVVLYRRFMVRLTERIARRRGCLAMVTGESLGQVASQTLENIETIDVVAGMPILRPLIGSDKQDILAEAQKIGTYDISVRKDQDCCSLFIPSRPATRATPEQAARAEESLDVEGLIADALERTEEITYSWPAR